MTPARFTSKSTRQPARRVLLAGSLFGLFAVCCHPEGALAAGSAAVPTRPAPAAAPTPSMEEGFDVFTIAWTGSNVPRTMQHGETVVASVSVKNVGSRTIPRKYLSISYHWLDASDPNKVAVYDGLRNFVTRDIAAGATYDAKIKIKAPDKPGRYALVLDVVRDWIAWFSKKGAPTVRVEVRVQ